MTNEQEKAKELAELLTAFAGGKQLQLQVKNLERWSDLQVSNIEELIKNFNVPLYSIRIKPETKRIALNQQDLIDRELRKETIRLSNSELILAWSHKYVTTAGNTYSYKYLLDKEFTFLDNSPCYKEVECE